MNKRYTVIGGKFIIEVIKLNDNEFVIETDDLHYIPFPMKEEYEVIEGSLKNNYRRLDKENRLLKNKVESLTKQIEEQYSPLHLEKYLEEIKNLDPDITEVGSIIQSYNTFLREVFGMNFWSINSDNIKSYPNGLEKDYLKLNLFVKYHKNPDRSSFIAGDKVKLKPKNLDVYLDGEIVGFQGIEPYDPIVHFTNTDGNPMTNSFSPKLLILK